MPVDLSRYPAEWKQIADAIKFTRAAGVCEWPGCTARHGEPNPLTGSKVVLTVAHLPVDCCGVPMDVHDKMQAGDWHMLALCQKHHLMLDAQEHAANRKRSQMAKRAAGTLFELAEVNR